MEKIPCFDAQISAGFPTATDDHIEKMIDLNEHLVAHPAATFFVKVEGNSMQDANIYSGDLLIVDRALIAKNRDIVVAMLNGEFTVKRLIKKETSISLVAENKNYSPIHITQESDFQIWGVVSYVIHRTR